jgi:two-component system sensor histidine kinase VanS
MKKLKRKLTFYILSRFLIWIAVFTGILALVFVIAVSLGRRQTWQPGILYDFLHFLLNNMGQLFIFIWGIGFILIFIRFWFKTLGYLEKVVKATEAVYRSESELIILPDILKEAENQLNQIKINIKESQRLAKDVEQKKNDLILYLAHDLQTPLTSVIGYITLLMEEQGISEETKRKYLAVTYEKARRLEELLNEFFEITRYNLTSLSLEMSEINLTMMIEQITHEFMPAFIEKNLKYELALEPGLMLKCDANKMRRVFDNLIRNAVNYSHNDTIMTISGGRFRDGAKIKVRNAGDTIPPEKLSRLFEQFYRVDGSRGTMSGGAGLGLAIAKEIVTLHGGAITAFSEDGIIEFEVTIPGLQ